MDFNKLQGKVLGQHGDEYSTDIEFIIAGFDKVKIINNEVIGYPVTESTEYALAALFRELKVE